MEMPAGQPSITTPKPIPCDSPKVVILNICPKVFPATFFIAKLGNPSVSFIKFYISFQSLLAEGLID